MVHKGLHIGAVVLAVQVALCPASAQEETAGLKLARTLCATCHAVAPGEIGLHPLAPTFQDIASRYSVWDLEEALAEGILVGHASMPQFKLKPKDIRDLLTYMDALPKLKKQPQ